MSRGRFSSRNARYDDARGSRPYRRDSYDSYERSRSRRRSRSREGRPYRSRSRERSYSPDRRRPRYANNDRNLHERQSYYVHDSVVPPVETVVSISRDNLTGEYRSSSDQRRDHRRSRSPQEYRPRNGSRGRDYAEGPPPSRQGGDSSRRFVPGDLPSGDEKPRERSKSPYSGPMEKPDFGLSGALAKSVPMSALQEAAEGRVAATNTRNGVQLKWSNPPDMTLPDKKWRLYPFSGDKDFPPISLHQSGCYLFGRDRTVADIPTDNPSCSKQHAVLFFR